MPRGKPNYIDPIGKRGGTFNVTPVKQKPVCPVVYFVQATNGLIKIGNTKQLKWRFESLQGQSPLPLEILATTPGNRTVEFAYHATFAEHRQHGEWFKPAPELLAEIDRLNNQPAPLGYEAKERA